MDLVCPSGAHSDLSPNATAVLARTLHNWIFQHTCRRVGLLPVLSAHAIEVEAGAQLFASRHYQKFRCRTHAGDARMREHHHTVSDPIARAMSSTLAPAWCIRYARS